MKELYDIAINVVSQKGHCEKGHKVGDEWVFKDGRTCSGICIAAFLAFAADLRVLRHGGVYPWASNKDSFEVACTDGKNPVIFELKRLNKVD
jgi:uncharacterized repeat protein (TIGR04076 family)